MATKKKRLSYTISAGDSSLEPLELPPPNLPRHFDPRPRLFSATTGQHVSSNAYASSDQQVQGDTHPQHCLGVSALALDASTVVLPDDVSDDDSDHQSAPSGILYSAGRDGLLAAWQLDLPMKQRHHRSGCSRSNRRARKARLYELGAFRDGDKDSEDEDEDAGSGSAMASDSDSDHERNGRKSRTKNVLGDVPYEEKWQVDSARLARREDGPRTTFRQSVQPHSDWINDIVLCNMNRTVVSASSDQTIRAWNPHEPQDSLQPAVLGTHDDFVKCLAHSRTGNWIASGGFDRKIKIWDIEQSSEKPLTDWQLPSEQDSIYALATTPCGNILASGSPSKIVRLWDPRAARPEIARLHGHAENIRSLLVSEDGKVVLSASADSTIKLWSTSMQRCLHTFTHHNESVWSLFSNHPDLDIFYSGDRSGLVCKVDLEGCGDMEDGECVVLCKDDDTLSTNGAFGLTEGINSIAAIDDTFLWTSTGSSSIVRWRDIPPRRDRIQPSRGTLRHPLSSGLLDNLPLPSTPQAEEASFTRVSPFPSLAERRGVSFAPSTEESETDNLSVSPGRSPMSASFAATHQRRRSSSLKQNGILHPSSSPLPFARQMQESKLDGIPLASLVCFALGNTFSPNAVMQRQQYTESLASLSSAVQRWPHTPHSGNSFGGTRINSRNLDNKDEAPAQHVSPEMLDYAQRELATDAVPLRLEADEVIWGRKGLIRCEQLNDRRTVLTADTAGDIAAWDIINCRCLGTFLRSSLAEAQPHRINRPSSADRGRQVKELLEIVRNRVEGEGTAQAWATVDVRVGTLSVHLEEGRCFSAEMYTDDLDLDTTTPVEALRLNPGKIILRNLLDNFLSSTVQQAASVVPPADTQLRQARPSHIAISKTPSPLSLDLSMLTSERKGSLSSGIAMATPAATSVLPPTGSDLSKRPTSVSLGGRRTETLADEAARTPLATTSSVTDYFNPTSTSDPTSNSSTKTASSKLMGRLKGLGRSGIKKAPLNEPTEGEPAAEATPSTDNKGPHPEFQAQLDAVAQLLAQPLHIPIPAEVPTIRHFPRDLVYAVSEQANISGVWSATYRGFSSATDAGDTHFMAHAPLWVLEYLLTGKVPPLEPLKITFVLQPWSDGITPPLLPEMPESHSRLTANRVLRMSKLSAFVVDKLDFFHQPPATSPAEISRNPSHTSLASYNSGQSGIASLKPMFMNRAPEDIVELVCNNTVLPHRATLAAVRQFCFKKSSDLVLHYRLKTGRRDTAE